VLGIWKGLIEIEIKPEEDNDLIMNNESEEEYYPDER